MRPLVFLFAATFLLFPSASQAQSTGRVECARSDGYIYLYSSMTTLDVRTTLQCGEIVQITGRYEVYFAARTSKGETGYIPIANIVILKDQVGTGLPQPGTKTPSRERTPYDERPAPPPAPATPPVPTFGLLKDTPIRMHILKPLSSTTAHTGDVLEFKVLEDVFVDGLLVVAKGAKAQGAVVVVEPKKHFGHDGKIALNITSVHLADDESAPVRCFYETVGSSNSSANPVLPPIGSGKDASIAQGTEFTARVDGDVHLKRESFVANVPKGVVTPLPVTSTAVPPSHR